MDIAIVTSQLSGYGGSEIYLLECLRRWQSEADVTVYTPSFNRALFKEFGIGARVKVVELPAASCKDDRYDLFEEIVVMPRLWEQQIGQHDLYFLYLMPMQMIRRHPSVWFAAEPCRMIYDLRQHPDSGEGEIEVHFYPKLSYDQILPEHLEVLLQAIERIDAKSDFDRLVVNSMATGRYVENIYGRTADAVAYPGTTLPDDTTPPDTFDKVLCVGRLWKHKRVDLALKALALTNSPNQLILAGEGPELPRLKELADQLDLSDKVVFAGEVSMAERERLYSEATCCVYTAVREPFGMVPLEAAAAGRPVVATAGGGYAEILDDTSALFVPAYEGAIARGIHELMSNPRRAMKMGRAGRRIAAQHSWDRTARTLMDVFRETVESPPRGTKVAASRKSVDPQLGAHYYPWYRAGDEPLHWNENTVHSGVTDFPSRGPYSSTNPTVAERHLRDAAKAGVDFFVVNLQVDFRGLDPVELEATSTLFDVAERLDHPVELAILLAFNTEDPKVILRAIRKVKRAFLSRPAYHRREDTPFLWFFFNDPFQGFFYHHYRELASLCRGVHPVATGSVRFHKFMPELLAGFFKGWSFYSPLEAAPPKLRRGLWEQSYRDFGEEENKLRFFTISPGFDDTHLTDAARGEHKIRRVPRRGTQTYELMQRAAAQLQPRADYVVVTSFNEFHENTHIEPSKKFGRKFLTSTRRFKDRLLG